jgi:hypothetical protein
MDAMTPELQAHKHDRMADFFVRCENGGMTHELMAGHLMEVLGDEPGRTYEITLARLYEKAPTKAALDDYARQWAQDVGARMGLAGYPCEPMDQI